MPIITEVKTLSNYRLWVKFDDGIEGVLDLTDLVGQGVFAAWNDYKKFESVHIGLSGELAWDDKIDLCPDSLYLRITKKNPEDIFPRLRELASHARD